MDLYQNIPDEMKTYRQWVVWKYETPKGGTKKTKVPYNPITRMKASPINPLHWGTFDDACNQTHAFDGIGFVLTEQDPYCFIDIDKTDDPELKKRQIGIFNAFNSYTERSVSGAGAHIICKAEVPVGRKRFACEIYSTARYMTMTGDILKEPVINECQTFATMLWEDLKSPRPANEVIYEGSAEEKYSDREIVIMGRKAKNGDKFTNLAKGEWQAYYDSQSQADFALINMIAFYTDNPEQVIRLFRGSALGQREKAKRDGYVKGMVKRSFDRKVPPNEFKELEMLFRARIEEQRKIEAAAYEAEKRKHKPIVAPKKEDLPSQTYATVTKGEYDWPPGMTGELARFIYDSSPRPVKKIAIFAAIGIMSGVCGRAYNVSGTGLNQYMLLVAQTGRGKEAIQKGCSRLFQEIESECPQIDKLKGPGYIASAPALIRHMNSKSKSLLCVLGEFGVTLQEMAGQRASPNSKALMGLILQLYNKSGEGDVYDGAVYADNSKNIQPLDSPALTIVGESAPEKLYTEMDESFVGSGLIPRFLILDSDDKRTKYNKAASRVVLDPDLKSRFAQMCTNIIMLNQHNNINHVQFSEEGESALDAFDAECDFIMNSTKNSLTNELYNRCHLKAMKLAAALAVGENSFVPTISLHHAEWAINLVRTETDALIGKFKRGEVGSSGLELQQNIHITEWISEYTWFKARAKKGSIEEKMQQMRIVPHKYLQKRASNHRKFRDDRVGPTNALKRAIAVLVSNGDINYIDEQTLRETYGYRGIAYQIISLDTFRE